MQLSFSLFLGRLAKLDILDGIGILIAGDESQVVEDVVLLEVLLGEVLQVALLEVGLGGDSDLLVGDGDGDALAEVALLAADLDVRLEEIDELSGDKEVVLEGDAEVDEELGLLLGGSLRSLSVVLAISHLYNLRCFSLRFKED